MPRRPPTTEPSLLLTEPGATEPRFDPTTAVPSAVPGAAPAALVPEDDEDAVARFEQEMDELEAIVAQMERGDLRLEDSLRLFERGTQLVKSCRGSLDSAELRITRLLGNASDDEAS